MNREKCFSDIVGKKHEVPYILCSAIHILDGKLYSNQPYNIDTGLVVSGRRHSDCYTTLMGLCFKFVDGYKDIQGFITSDNRFVDRYEAYEIAVVSNQIEIRYNRLLISEDIY